MTKKMRKEISANAIHSNEMEGVPATEEVMEFANNYETGAVSSHELIKIAKDRYGI